MAPSGAAAAVHCGNDHVRCHYKKREVFCQRPRCVPVILPSYKTCRAVYQPVLACQGAGCAEYALKLSPCCDAGSVLSVLRLRSGAGQHRRQGAHIQTVFSMLGARLHSLTGFMPEVHRQETHKSGSRRTRACAQSLLCSVSGASGGFLRRFPATFSTHCCITE
ncbi:hypothetical protein JZ751_018861 [Albula glossodonta]|uniref:Uncharacterized protein n=1 Tax=Albula glossodonta TaxID=121402 RepID=A0A8T2MWH3_9TELE|nr:hypothetical protein JZ751_018861 [Albula glossodonta]